MKRLYILFFFLSTVAFAQDIHFTQFDLSPITLNPAMGGLFDGDIRIAANMRNQYSSVPVPYSTFSASYDQKFDIKGLLITGGGLLYSDKAGDGIFTTSQIAPEIAIGKLFTASDSSSHSFSIGLQPQVTQRTIDFNKLSFDNQFVDGFYDPLAQNGETFQTNNFTYFNLGGGLGYHFSRSNKMAVTTGVSVSNLIGPKQSFFGDKSISLHPRMTFHAGAGIKLTNKVSLNPGLLFMSQHKYKELLLGSSVGYTLIPTTFKFTKVSAGLWLRNSDAFILRGGMEYQNITAGISYDLNFSPLKAATEVRGGWEIAVIYIIKKVKPPVKKKVCPVYI